MEYGPDTEPLLTMINNLGIGNTLDLRTLNITSLPQLPTNLTKLECSYTPITELPPLPITLKLLKCANTQITELPATLKLLDCSHTQITELPELPTTLERLLCSDTQITELPPLPLSLKELQCRGCPLVIPRKQGESIAKYEARWCIYREEKASRALQSY